MGLMNWFASKALGVPTIDKSCYDNVIVFLTKKNIDEPTFSFLKAERSDTNQRFNNRVYFGTGTRNAKKIAFLLHVNEDIPRPDGAVVDESLIGGINKIYRNWLGMPDYVRGSLYGFALGELGGKLEALDGIYTGD